MSEGPRRRVLLLAGGRSSEREVSLASGEAVRARLIELGHEVLAVEIDADGCWRQVENFAGGTRQGDPLALTPGRGALDADVAMPVLHGPFGEDGTIQGLLESLDIPYVGAGVAASALCIDKLLFKDLMAHHGIDQVDYRAIEAPEWQSGPQQRAGLLAAAGELGLPVFVKPARLGSSVGISRVGEPGELEAAIEQALAHDPRVIVEASSDGAEIECAVIGNNEVEVSRPGRVEFDSQWYDFESKYEQGGMRLVAPAPLSEPLEIEICSLAARVFRLSGCAGLARVDFFVEGERVLVNELNTLPGFTATSVFPKLFEASGLDYGVVLERLIELALERHARERAYRF
jgi:D-alanine-D-alanine ligase